MIPPTQTVAVDVLSEQVNLLVALFAESLGFVNNAIGGPTSLAPARERDDTK